MGVLSRSLSLRTQRVVTHDGVKQGLFAIAEVLLRALHLKALRLLSLVQRIFVIILVCAS